MQADPPVWGLRPVFVRVTQYQSGAGKAGIRWRVSSRAPPIAAFCSHGQIRADSVKRMQGCSMWRKCCKRSSRLADAMKELFCRFAKRTGNETGPAGKVSEFFLQSYCNLYHLDSTILV